MEPTSCPTLTKGVYAFDYGDTAKMAPIAKMYTLGHDFMPPGIHAGGLRYHGASPLVSQLVQPAWSRPGPCRRPPVSRRRSSFPAAKGSSRRRNRRHAIRGAIDEALQAKEEGKEKTILFSLSGHGHVDMAAYDAYFAGKLEDYEYPAEAIKESLAQSAEGGDLMRTLQKRSGMLVKGDHPSRFG